MNSWLLAQQLILSQQFDNNNLPHAILINGVTGAGNLELAQWLLHLLSCKQPQTIQNSQKKFYKVVVIVNHVY